MTDSVSPGRPAGPGLSPLAHLRRAGAAALRARVAGDDAEVRAQRIWGAAGDRWFTPEDPIWRVHADASMFTGGIRALLLQSLHPLALAGVEEHSDYRDDPWQRVQNTSEYLAATTFGTVEHAEEVIERVRRIHTFVHGTAPDGRRYAADDPHLLRWVHVAEIDSFLSAYQHFAARPLTPAEADRYVEQTGRAAALLGVVEPPRSVEALRDDLASYRSELATSPAVRRVTRFLLLDPPLPLLARPAYRALASGAVATLPAWARRMLGVGRLLPGDAVVGLPLGKVATSTIRWFMTDPSVAR